MMHPRAKRHMAVRIPRDVKHVRILKRGRIPIGGRDEPPHAVIFANRLAAQVDIFRRDTLNQLDGGIIAQTLLCGRFQQLRRVLFEPFPLLGMAADVQTLGWDT
jgi:hypothetical protein